MTGDDLPNPRLSLLDVLLDGRPHGGTGSLSYEPTGNRRSAIRRARRAIERDLEMLLCTRQRHLAWPAPLDAINGSILNFGIADRSETNLASNRAKDELRHSIELTIKQFEPRLKNVAVQLLKPRPGEDRRIRFQIEGQLRFDNDEVIALSTILDPVMRTFVVQSPMEQS